MPTSRQRALKSLLISVYLDSQRDHLLATRIRSLPRCARQNYALGLMREALLQRVVEAQLNRLRAKSVDEIPTVDDQS